MSRQRQAVTGNKVWSPPTSEMKKLNYLGKGQTISDRLLYQVRSLCNRVIPQNKLAKGVRTALRNRVE